MKQTSDFAKGAAWGAGFTIHEIGRALCLDDEDAQALIQRHRKSPPPIRRQTKPRRQKAISA